MRNNNFVKGIIVGVLATVIVGSFAFLITRESKRNSTCNRTRYKYDMPYQGKGNFQNWRGMRYNNQDNREGCPCMNQNPPGFNQRPTVTP